MEAIIGNKHKWVGNGMTPGTCLDNNPHLSFTLYNFVFQEYQICFILFIYYLFRGVCV